MPRLGGPSGDPRPTTTNRDDEWEVLESFQPPPPAFTTSGAGSPTPEFVMDTDDSSDDDVDRRRQVALPSSMARRQPSPSSPSSSFNTITHQGPIWVLIHAAHAAQDDDEDYDGDAAWEERYALCQPTRGLFVFQDELEADNWKTTSSSSSSSSSPFYDQQHLLIDSFSSPLELTKTTLDDQCALVISSSSKSALTSLAFATPQEREEWIVALHNAGILARYLVAASSSTSSVPVPAFAKKLLREMTPHAVFHSLDFSGALDLADPIPALNRLVLAFGAQHLVRLALNNGCLNGEVATLHLPASLQELDLANNSELGDAGFCALLDANPHLPQLRSLCVSNCGLGDVSMKRLATFAQQQPQQHTAALTGRVDVSRNYAVSVLGAYDLALVVFGRGAEHVDFAHCDLLQDEFCDVIALLFNKRMKHLSLADTGVTDRGLAVLVERGLARMAYCTVDLRGNEALSLKASQRAAAKQLTNRLLLSSLLEEDGDQDLQLMVLNGSANDSVEEDALLPYDSTCLVACFEFGPLPSYERLFRFLHGELGGRAEIKLFPSADDGRPQHEYELCILGDCDAALVKQLQLQLEQNRAKYAVFRIERIVHPYATSSPAAAIKALTNAEEEEAPASSITFLPNASISLAALANAVYDVFFSSSASSSGGKLDIVRFQFEGLLASSSPQQISPSLRQAIQHCLLSSSVLKPSIISAANAIEFEDAPQEYDALAWLQLAALTGNGKLAHQVFAKLRQSQSFCRRLSKIISTRYPLLVAAAAAASSQEEEELDFVLLSEEMISAKLHALFMQTSIEAFCTQASELLGRVARNALSLHDLHVVMMFRTCQADDEDDNASMRQLEWMFACAALRMCPPATRALQTRLREHYLRCFEATGEAMAQVCCRTLLHHHHHTATNEAKMMSVKQRLVFIRQCFRERHLPVAVHLPDKTAVIVDCPAFASTFAGLLAQVDRKLAAASSSEDQQQRVDWRRWQGFVFVSRQRRLQEQQEEEEEVLRFEDDPFWWAQRSSSCKLFLVHAVPSFFALHSDFSDRVRISLLFEQERRALSAAAVTPYVAVLLSLEALGDEAFRYEMSSSRMLQYVQAKFPRVAFAPELVERHRVDFLTSLQQHGAGLLHKTKLQAAFLHLWRFTNCSSSSLRTRFVGVQPEHVCAGGGVLMDSTALQGLGLTLDVDAKRGGISVYFDTNLHDALVHFPFESLVQVEEEEEDNGTWIKLVGAGDGGGDWTTVRFARRWEARLFVDQVHMHLWALLAHGGLVQYDGEYADLMAEEFAFRFPGLPTPPPVAFVSRQEGAAARRRHAHVSAKVKQSRFHAQVLVDQLFRPFGCGGGGGGAVFCGYAPMDTTAFLGGGGRAGDGEEEDEGIELPLTMPPAPQQQQQEEEEDGYTDEEEEDIPLPPDSPPPPPTAEEEEEEEEEEDFDVSLIAPPAGPPPPPPPSSQPVATIADANAPASWISANDLQAARNSATPPPPAKQQQQPMSMMDEMRLRQQKRGQADASLEPSTPASTPPASNASTPPPKRLSNDNNNALLLESMLQKKTQSPPQPVQEAPAAAAAILLPSFQPQPQEEEDPNAKRKAEFLRKKREREAAEAAQ